MEACGLGLERRCFIKKRREIIEEGLIEALALAHIFNTMPLPSPRSRRSADEGIEEAVGYELARSAGRPTAAGSLI